MDSFGTILNLVSFGESHGPAIGGVLTGVPAGAEISIAEVQAALDRRRPGKSPIASRRREADRVEILSGLMNGMTLGTPIGFIIRNTDSRSADYDQLADAYRPSHADYTYEAKYGLRDHRGGGRASARETACRVVAGAIASQILSSKGIKVTTFTSRIGTIAIPDSGLIPTVGSIIASPVACPDEETSLKMTGEIEWAKADGDTLGGIVECIVTGVPAGLGEPIFGKLQSRLAAAMLTIPAAKGFDYGMGFDGASCRGSEMIDSFRSDFSTVTNHSGGIQGGISNGADIRFRVAFKPVATLMRPVETVDRKGCPVTLQPRGRHDVCVVPRAVPVVEAMCSLVLLDALLLNRAARL